MHPHSALSESALRGCGLGLASGCGLSLLLLFFPPWLLVLPLQDGDDEEPAAEPPPVAPRRSAAMADAKNTLRSEKEMNKEGEGPGRGDAHPYAHRPFYECQSVQLHM
jgi:hypothetical protein